MVKLLIMKYKMYKKHKKISKAVEKCRGLCIGCHFKKQCTEERESYIVEKALEENIRLTENVKALTMLVDEYETRLYEIQQQVKNIII